MFQSARIFWRQAPAPNPLLPISFSISPSQRLLHMNRYCTPSVLFLLSIFLHILSIWRKSFCILVCVHSLSISTTVSKEPFSAPPVLIHIHYSRLNFAMLGITMLGDVPWQFRLWGAFKNFWQKLGQLFVKNRQGRTVINWILNHMHHDKCHCSFVYMRVLQTSITPSPVIPLKIALATGVKVLL